MTSNIVSLEEKQEKATRIVAYTTRLSQLYNKVIGYQWRLLDNCWIIINHPSERLIAGKTKAIASHERRMEAQKRYF